MSFVVMARNGSLGQRKLDIICMFCSIGSVPKHFSSYVCLNREDSFRRTNLKHNK